LFCTLFASIKHIIKVKGDKKVNFSLEKGEEFVKAYNNDKTNPSRRQKVLMSIFEMIYVNLESFGVYFADEDLRSDFLLKFYYKLPRVLENYNLMQDSSFPRLHWRAGRCLELRNYAEADLLDLFEIMGVDLTDAELDEIERMSLKINDVLTKFLKTKRVDLIDFKLEFGKDADGKIILADEISPDNCRFWDSDTKEKLDKDRFRRDLGNVEDAYKEMLHRLTGEA